MNKTSERARLWQPAPPSVWPSTQYLISALIGLVAIYVPALAAAADSGSTRKNVNGNPTSPAYLVQIAKPVLQTANIEAATAP
jgi:hypothetical protein